MIMSYESRSSRARDWQLKVQSLEIPFKITHHATPGSKSIYIDEPSVLQIGAYGISGGVVLDPSQPVITPPPTLGSAGNYAVLAYSTITNTGTTNINGSLALSPGTSVTGAPTVTGTSDIANGAASTAQTDLTAAIVNLNSFPVTTNYSGTDLGTLTLSPGVYKFNTSAQLTGTVVLDAGGDSSAVWIFQIGSTLTTASSSVVSLINGASPANVFWNVGTSATLGTSTTFKGNILAGASITVNTSVTVNGSLLASTGAVTFDTNVLTKASIITTGTFDLITSDSAGAFNLVIKVTPEIVLRIVHAEVMDRITGLRHPCYPNALLNGLDSTKTRMLLNCPSAVNLATTDLDAAVKVYYIAHQ
jgi:hypothetical protein